MEKKTKVIAGTSIGLATVATLFFGSKAIKYLKAKKNTKEYIEEIDSLEETNEEKPKRKYITLTRNSRK